MRKAIRFFWALAGIFAALDVCTVCAKGKSPLDAGYSTVANAPAVSVSSIPERASLVVDQGPPGMNLNACKRGCRSDGFKGAVLLRFDPNPPVCVCAVRPPNKMEQ
jgi:hypothetical protein